MGDGDGGSPRRHRTRRAVGLKDSGSAASPLAREPADDSIGSAPNGSTGSCGRGVARVASSGSTESTATRGDAAAGAAEISAGISTIAGSTLLGLTKTRVPTHHTAVVAPIGSDSAAKQTTKTKKAMEKAATAAGRTAAAPTAKDSATAGRSLAFTIAIPIHPRRNSRRALPPIAPGRCGQRTDGSRISPGKHVRESVRKKAY